MEVYFQLITDAETLRSACEDLRTRDVLGFDTETTELDPYLGIIRLVQLSDGANTKVIDLKPFAAKGDLRTLPELAPLRELLAAPKPVKVAHNAKFDAKWVRHHLGVDLGGVFDTLLASQLIAAGDQDRRHNLAEVAQVFAGIELDKSEQVSDWSGELSQSQIEYAARDAATMVPLREKIVERLRADDLVKAAKLEFDCVMPVAAMELAGFYLDKARWLEQLEKVKKEQEKVALELQQMLSAGVAQASLFGAAEINLNSQAQVTDALKNLGVPVPETTRGWQLQPLANDYPVIAKLLEYRAVAKSLTSFGENILEYIEPKTGRIHADFRQIGAPTGRMSCLSGDTLVSTKSGLRRIDKICEGELVKTLYGYRRVKKAWSNGWRQTFTITLNDGRKIRATGDHLFLTGKADVWKRLDKLKIGDDLFVSLKTYTGQTNESTVVPIPFNISEFRARKLVEIPQKLSVKFCELLGLAFADGFLGKRHVRPADKKRRWSSTAAEYDRLYLAFNGQDEDLIKKILDTSQRLFGVPLVETKCRTCRLFQLPSTKLAQFFAQLGLTNHAQTKRIPEIILDSPPRFQAAFLRGLFEGDGHRHENGFQRVIGLVSVNLHLLLQTQIILSHLGIYCTVRARKDPSGFGGDARYALEITKKSDISKFMSQIGFLSRRKNRAFNISRQITDGIATPFTVQGSQLYREAIALGTTPASRIGVKPFTQFYKNSAIKAETVEKLTERFGVLPSLKPVSEYMALGIRQVKIQSIEPYGIEEVFDLAIEDVPHFIANGVVVHNCSKPNIQQIPHEEAYRRCFRAEAGNKLIVADYSQIELRILADFSGDEQFIHAFQTGADFHTTTAAQIFNVKPEEVTSDQRSFAKRLNFGVVYGIGASRFAMMTGLTQTEAENIMRRYFGTYRKLDAWLREAAQKVTTQRVARTASGRMMRFRFEETDRQAIALAQRNGKNMPIQGTSADILKRALRLLHNSISGTSAKLVNIVHDEIIVEASAAEAEATAEKLENAMCKAGEEYVTKVPVKVDVKTADEWIK